MTKIIGKPYSGKLNVRFDEGELEIERKPLRQFSTLPIFMATMKAIDARSQSE